MSLRSELLRTLAGSTGVYLFGTAMGFLVGIQLARGLGVAGYGLYGSAMAAANLGATVASGGLQLHATREVAASLARKEPETAARLIGWSLRNVLVLGAAASISVGGYVLSGQGAETGLGLWAMFLTLLMSLIALAGAIVRGTEAVVIGQAMDVAIRPAAQSGLLLIAILGSGTIDPGLALALSCLAIIFALPFGWPAISRVWTKSPIRIASEEQRAWRRASATMGLTTIIRATEAALPLIILGAISTMEEAGIFRVATAVAVFSMFGVNIISAIAPQSAVRLYATGEMEKLRSLVAMYCFIMVIPSALLIPVLWIDGEAILTLLFGKEFSPATGPLLIVLFSSLIVGLGGMGTTLLHVSNNEKTVTTTSFVALIAVVLVSLVLIRRYGAYGAATSVLIGSFIRVGSQTIAARNLTGIDPSFFASILNIARHLRAKRLLIHPGKPREQE
ncbi:polysaccharide biosynthesis C-terminal domain-containing protein [Novosphingobium jiangmenense]|uniref:Polysaccharide biosynthesis C-terminal domain-containing protein n=1 Tax=Novosphingobium jiangmenense TaxID=2791981 RepID=A0ABS0HBJ2_9SPHN|nr:polysaccharide biosynthesis C-terminal domain-containing protein [Novosphingobium jiangmenense]MBF9149657.1 polysaccharide biosynthesis C-terminal domain-containing protein [Novosphingobium jiangmenense]